MPAPGKVRFGRLSGVVRRRASREGCEMRESVRRMLSGCVPAWQQLVLALQTNDRPLLRTVLADREIAVDTELPAPHLLTPLQLACRLKHDVDNDDSCIRILLDAGADPNSINDVRDGYTPLHFSAEASNYQALMELLDDERTDINARNGRGETVLHLLADKHEPEITNERNELKSCLEKLFQHPNLDVNRRSRQDRTAVLNAATKRNLTVLECLLESGRCDVDVPAPRQRTSVRDILKQDFPQLVLPAAGTVENKGDITTSLFQLLYNREIEMFIQNLDSTLKSLIERDSVLNADDGLWTFLQYACNYGMTDVVRKLLEEGADTNATSKSRRAQLPSILAAANGYEDILQLLLIRKGTLIVPKEGGDNALHAVLKDLHWKPPHSDRHRCFDLLLQHIEKYPESLDINAPDSNGDTPLHLAAYSTEEHYILSLLKLGVYIGTENRFGEPPLVNIPATILERYLDDCVTSNGEFPRVDKYAIQFDYNFLVPPSTPADCVNERDMSYSDCEQPIHSTVSQDHVSSVPESNPLLYISRSKDLRHLLKHPVFTSFLTLKWFSIRPIFYFNLALYSLFVLLMTVYILCIYDYSDMEENKSQNALKLTPENVVESSNNSDMNTIQRDRSMPIANIIKLILSVLVIIIIFRELFQFLMWPKRYIKNWENYLEILLITFSSLVLFGNFDDMNVRPHLSAITILFSWAELVLLIGRHPSLSTNIEMLKTVSVNFLQFLAWYSFLILAFALSFYTLFKSSQEDDNFFLNPGSSFFKTVVMVTGEFDASDLPFVLFPGTSHIVFVLFVFLVAIVLFNLLNGLAVSDTQSIKENAELVGYVSRVKLISYTESMLLGHPLWCQTPRKCCCCCTCCCFPLAQIRPFRFTQIPCLMQTVQLFPGILPEKKIRVLPNQDCKILFVQSDQSKTNEDNLSCVMKWTEYKLEDDIVKSAKDLLLQKGQQSKLEHIEEMLEKKIEEHHLRIQELEHKLGDVERAALSAKINTDKILDILSNKYN